MLRNGIIKINNKIPEIKSKPTQILKDNALKIQFGAFSKLKNAVISTSGIALKSGNIGDVLDVKNARSGIIIKGILNKNKKINVFF